jgi:hypothetical protein
MPHKEGAYPRSRQQASDARHKNHAGEFHGKLRTPVKLAMLMAMQRRSWD